MSFSVTKGEEKYKKTPQVFKCECICMCVGVCACVGNRRVDEDITQQQDSRPVRFTDVHVCLSDDGNADAWVCLMDYRGNH